MKHYVLRNALNAEAIASVRRAESLFDRTVGLMGASSVPIGEGMWFDNCSAIHTLFMRVAIDVVFLDGYGRVMRTLPAIGPNRPGIACAGARVTIELGEGTLREVELREGDRLYLEEMRVAG